jgi:hypothetical protein
LVPAFNGPITKEYLPESEEYLPKDLEWNMKISACVCGNLEHRQNFGSLYSGGYK